jgi:ribosome assembly protein YihI (activator of Der GTPase)
MPSRTRSSPLWDPQTVLKIDNMGRCAGWARTCGRNCANTIALRNQQNADCFMKAMSMKEPDSVTLETDLYRLAGFVLCRRSHQDQADDMVEKWSARMERFAAAQEQIETTRRGRYSASRASSTVSDASSYSGTSSRSARISTTSSIPSSRSSTASSPASPSSPGPEVRAMQSMMSQHFERIAQLEATIAALTAQVSAPAQTAPATGAGVPIQAASPSQTADATQLVTQAPVPAPIEPTSPQSRASSSPSPNPATAPPCTLKHVRRRAIDEECPICQADFLQHDQLVWCKSKCGRTVHRTCFDKWEEMCQDNERTATCVICRTPWENECEC